MRENKTCAKISTLKVSIYFNCPLLNKDSQVVYNYVTFNAV